MPETDLSLYSFFLSVGDMEVSCSHDRYYVKHREIVDSKMFARDLAIRFDDRCFFDLSEKERAGILENVGIDGICMIENPAAFTGACVRDLCRVLFFEDRAEGAVFVLKRFDNDLELSYLYSLNPLCTTALLHRTAKAVMSMDPGPGLVFDTVEPQARSMARKCFPHKKAVPVYKAEWC
ncbi:MAG: hypothetical protein K6F53_08220 [Lachnospiraceae bacterium]|nr:hypothetical protein [Lachnospiraceae bacterium]